MRAAAKFSDQDDDRTTEVATPSNPLKFSEIDRLESRRIVLRREVEIHEKELAILMQNGARRDDPRCMSIKRELNELAFESADILKQMSDLQPSNAREIGIMLTALSHHLQTLIKSVRGDEDEMSTWQQGENCQRILSGIQSAYATKRLA
jgi:hypothetical protein